MRPPVGDAAVPGLAVSLDANPLTDAPPLLLPLAAVALAVAVLGASFLGRWLRASPVVAFVIIFDVGLLLAAALSPVVCELPAPASGVGACDLSRVGLVSPAELTGSADIAANVVALIPLGFALAFVPWSPRKAAVLVGALVLPIAIEAVQLLAVPLNRACQSRDVVDNLTGLALGLVAGTAVAWVGRRLAR